MNVSLQIEPVYELPEVVWIEGRDHRPAIHSIVRRLGRLWAFGQNVLLGSPDGRAWNDEARNLRRDGEFNICAITEYQGGLCVFARSRNGLNCYGFDSWAAEWKAVSEIETESPCISPTWTKEGLVAALRTKDGTEIRGFDPQLQRKFSSFLPGVPEHWQMTESGIGLCAVRDRGSGDPVPWSEVYSTIDYGRTWSLVDHLPETLLAGAAASPASALLGGTGGFLALVVDGQVNSEWREAGGDVVALDCEGDNRIAVVEADDLEDPHRFLFSSGSKEWSGVDTQFSKRVRAVKMLEGGLVLIADERGIYGCRRRPVLVV